MMLLRFREISFGKAVFFSILWHLFWISSITIVSLPEKVQYPRFADISFLGSLLDKPTFEVHVTQKPIVRGQSMIPQGRIGRSPFQVFPKEMPDLLKFTLPYSERSWGIPGEFLGLKKKNPISLLKEDGRFKEETPTLRGPVASRILYYRPKRPHLPKWIDLQEAGSNLELRFWVSPEGKVAGIEKVTSSGHPTLDMIGMRYLRRWQFSPKATEEEEWGTVTLHFPLSSK